MKNQFLCRAALLVFLLFLGVPCAYAQSTDRLLTLRIPFAFQIGEKQCPAGEYTFNRIFNQPEILIVQAPGRRTVVTLNVFSEDVERNLQPGLTFREYDGKRFLSEVRIAERGFRYSLIKSKAEHKLAQTVTARVIRAIPATDSSPAQHSQKLKAD